MPTFPRCKRLILASDFQQVFKDSNRITRHGITVLFRQNQSGYARLGLAIARRQLPLAVDRNRLKRLIRETFRQCRMANVDVVVVVKSSVKSAPNSKLIESLNELWNQLSTHSGESPLGPSSSC